MTRFNYPQVRFITPARELELAKLIAKGDPGEVNAARHELAMSAMPAALKACRKFQNQGVPDADLLQDAYLAVFASTAKFDPTRDGASSFRTFAMYNLLKELAAAVRKNGAATAIAEAAYWEAVEHRRHDGRTHLHGETQAESQPSKNAVAAAGWRTAASVDAAVSADGWALADTLADIAPGPEELAEAHDQAAHDQAQVRAMLRLLPDANRAVIEALFGVGRVDPLSPAEASRELGQTAPRTSQLRAEAMAQLAVVARLSISGTIAAAACSGKSAQNFVAKLARKEMAVARAARVQEKQVAA